MYYEPLLHHPQTIASANGYIDAGARTFIEYSFLGIDGEYEVRRLVIGMA